jgi:hypothetical protein
VERRDRILASRDERACEDRCLILDAAARQRQRVWKRAAVERCRHPPGALRPHGRRERARH